MKIRFVINNNPENKVDIDVKEVPTEKQAEAIREEIDRVMDEYEQENGDFLDFDYEACCYNATIKYIPVVNNRVVKTLYI